VKQFAIYLALLVFGGSAGLLFSRHLMGAPSSSQKFQPVAVSLPPTTRDRATETEMPPSTGSNFIAEAADQVGPAVVRIDRVMPQSDTSQNPFFHQFFGDQVPEQPESGTGSGFILTDDGQVMTNAHVVSGTDLVKVTLKDGRSFDGKVIGIDTVTDVAVVKIDAHNLPTVRLGNSDAVLPGQWAIAIGNPLGLDNTVTAGIISAIGRSGYEVGDPNFQDKRVRFIQTDAAINPGNSGGPLLNDRGEVIGINTVIRADAQGLGFAIPIQTANRVAKQLFSQGKAEHPFIGIQMVDLTPDLKKELNNDTNVNATHPKISQDRGVLIVRVLSDSPATQAGLKEGDVIQKVDGKPIKTASEVQEWVESKGVGNLLQLEVYRNGQTQTIKVQLGKFPAKQ
jgi:S1-C subfamily serine protease